jgi:hypothetical protein
MVSAMAKKNSKHPADEYTFLAIRVERYNASAEASLNLDLKMSRPLFARDDHLVYTFASTLKISGVSTYPESRAGERYEVTVRGEAIHAGDFNLTLRDVQKRDAHGVPVYRTYRGERLPIYQPPPGIAFIERRRGEAIWDLGVFVAPRLVSDMLVLLAQPHRPLFLSLHEKKLGRQRWIESIGLQTTDPAEE